MKIYHGSTGSNLEEAREAAPSYTHGYCWIPQKMTPKDAPYILDNGAFSAYKNNTPWDSTAFVGRLNQLETMPRDPDFVILPDVVTNPQLTKERAQKWAGIIDYRTAFPCQDGIQPEEAAEFANRIGAEVLFIGGTREWKQRNAEALVQAAHGAGLDCHIGRPGNLTWAEKTGADSVDTTTIVQDAAWHKLEQLEGQESLAQWGGARV